MASASFLVDDFHMHDKTLETFHLVWLDDYKNKNEEWQNTQKQLRTTINHLKTFDEVCECQKYIEEISKQDRVILIVSGRLGLEVVPHIHELRQVSSIYIYSMKETENEQWTETYPKVTHSNCILMQLYFALYRSRPLVIIQTSSFLESYQITRFRKKWTNHSESIF